MPDAENPYQATVIPPSKPEPAAPGQLSAAGAPSKRFVFGIVLVFLSIATMVYAIHGMHEGLVELSAPVAPNTVPPKPAEIAAAMNSFAKLGYVAAVMSVPAVLLTISGFRKNKPSLAAER
jgi:Na+-transporting methylmalonyl-CoA/oxaloacetate decarboxylase gamma subunit